MSNVPPTPYGEEGDARPVSLIGAQFSAATPRSGTDEGDLHHRDGDDPDAAYPSRSGRRRHRRGRAGDTQPTAAPHSDEAFHLGDRATALPPPAGARPEQRSQPAAGRPTGADSPTRPVPPPTAPPPAAAPAATESARPPRREPTGDATASRAARPRTGWLPATPLAAAPGDPDAVEPPLSARQTLPRSRPAVVAPPPATPPPSEAARPAPPAPPDRRATRPRATGPRPAPPAEPTKPATAADEPWERDARPVAPTGRPAGRQPDAALPVVADTAAAAHQRPAPPPPLPVHDPGDPDGDFDDGLAPWDEIPLRDSLADRAASELPGSWRIGVTSAFPYSGTTTLVGILGLVLTGARGESVLAVDLRPRAWPTEDPDEPRGDPLCPRVGLPGDVTVADVARRRGGTSGALRELIGGLTRRGVPELDVVPLSRGDGDGDGGTGDGTAAVVPADDTVTPGMLRTALGHLTRAYPLVLVDAPVEAPLSPTALRASDLVVVVSLAAPADLDRTAAALRDPAAPLLPVDAHGRRPPVIVAVVSPRRGRWSPRTRAAAGRLSRSVDTLVRIPYESRLDPSRRAPVRIPRLRASTRRSYLHLGVAVVERLARLAAEESTNRGATTNDTTRGSTPETLRTPVV